MARDDNAALVTVVIPVYCRTSDHERFLREALRGVAAQTFTDLEVVLVDDASPIDITLLVEAVEGLPRTRIVRNAANLGHAGSRNVGVRAAEADLIAFLDHDDLWLPEKLERQVEALHANPDAAMVFCDVEIIGPHRDGLYVDQSTIPQRPDLCWFVTHNNCVISVSSALVRKQALLDIGLFDSRYSTCDDFDAWIKILMDTPIVHMPQKLATYRLHSQNANYGVDRLTDNKLLTALLLQVWRRTSARCKLLLLPVLARKLVGRAYFALRSASGPWGIGSEGNSRTRR